MENKHMALFYAFVLFASVCTKPTPIDENQESVSEDSGRENSKIVKKLEDYISAMNENNKHLIQKAIKRGFDIKTFFSPVYRKDGSVLLIPKDVNKNHYFIG